MLLYYYFKFVVQGVVNAVFSLVQHTVADSFLIGDDDLINLRQLNFYSFRWPLGRTVEALNLGTEFDPNNYLLMSKGVLVGETLNLKCFQEYLNHCAAANPSLPLSTCLTQI